MIDSRRRRALVGMAALGVAALLGMGIGIGFWIGRANPRVDADVLQGTVTKVEGNPSVTGEFSFEVDLGYALKSYHVTDTPWSSTKYDMGNGLPPCLVYQHRLTFAVVHFRHGPLLEDEVVWFDCGSDTG